MSVSHPANSGDSFGAAVQSRRELISGVKVRGRYEILARSPYLIRPDDRDQAVGLLSPLGHKLTARGGRLVVPIALAERAVLRLDPGSSRNRLQSLLKRAEQPRELWRDFIDNLVVNLGLSNYLQVTLGGIAATTTWFVGLTDSTPTVAPGDTMASHPGWVEVINYDEAVRQTWQNDAESGQQISNATTKANFSINASTTVGGGFLTSDNAKSGTAGILFSAGAFAGGDKSVGNGDTLSVQATFTMAAA